MAGALTKVRLRHCEEYMRFNAILGVWVCYRRCGFWLDAKGLEMVIPLTVAVVKEEPVAEADPR